jgi:hypothetical protein
MQVSLSADTNFQLYLKQQITSCFQPILSGFIKPVKWFFQINLKCFSQSPVPVQLLSLPVLILPRTASISTTKKERNVDIWGEKKLKTKPVFGKSNNYNNKWI